MASSLAYNGFNYVSYYNGAYENADSLPSLVSTGANAVALDIENGIDVKNSTVYADANYTDSLTALGDTIAEASADGLSVMVRPLIDFVDPSLIGSYSVGDWRSEYNPKNVSAFFASYQTMIVNEAKVAQANGASILSIGAEMDQLTGPQYLSYWTQIISAVRAVFSGKLTYSADWDDDISPWKGANGLPAGTGNLATQVSFWNQLDYVGVDGYAPLSDAANPTLAQLVAGWTQVPSDPTSAAVTGNQSLISYFQNLAGTVGKPLLFTELGYESATDAASQPSGSSTNVFDPGLQASLYQAFFDAWGQSGNGALAGVYFWNWDPNTAEVGPANGANFSPQGLPAQGVAEANFTTPAGATALLPLASGTANWTLGWSGGPTPQNPNNPPPQDSVQEGGLLVNGDLWNTSSSSSGTVTSTYNSNTGAITTNIDFSNWVYSGQSYNPAGYPNVSYGLSPFGGPNASVAALELPATVGAVANQGSLQIFTTYSIQNPNNDKIDLIYDTFLTQNKAETNPPTDLTDGFPTYAGNYLELAITLNLTNFPVSPVFDLTIPTVINGQQEDAQWGVYALSGGVGGPLVVFDLINQPDAANSASVGINLADILAHLSDSNVLALINQNVGNEPAYNIQSINNLYLDNLYLGSEFYPQQTSNEADYNYTLYSLSLSNPTSSTPAGTTADMLLQDTVSGQADIYNLGGNTILADNPLRVIGSDWQLVGLGGFNSGDSSDMLLRNGSGSFEVFDISDSQAAGPFSLGGVGPEWQVLGLGDFSDNANETDMLMRNSNSDAIEYYDIKGNQVVGAGPLGGVGAEWQFAGAGDFSSNPGETDMLMRDTNTGAFEYYDIQHNQVVAAGSLSGLNTAWQLLGVGDFSTNPNETDLLMRNTSDNMIEYYEIQHNQVLASGSLGGVGLEWQPVGFADLTGNANETDMIMRDGNTGAFEYYDIRHNQIVAAGSLGPIGTTLHVLGIADSTPLG